MFVFNSFHMSTGRFSSSHTDTWKGGNAAWGQLDISNMPLENARSFERGHSKIKSSQTSIKQNPGIQRFGARASSHNGALRCSLASSGGTFVVRVATGLINCELS
jgi:hypothetical protein